MVTADWETQNEHAALDAIDSLTNTTTCGRNTIYTLNATSTTLVKQLIGLNKKLVLSLEKMATKVSCNNKNDIAVVTVD